MTKCDEYARRKEIRKWANNFLHYGRFTFLPSGKKHFRMQKRKEVRQKISNLVYASFTDLYSAVKIVFCLQVEVLVFQHLASANEKERA